MLSGVRSSGGQSHAVEASLPAAQAARLERWRPGVPHFSLLLREVGSPARSLLLPPAHLSPHPQQLPHRPRRQTLHLIMQLRHRIKKSRHRRQPLPRKVRTPFFRIQLLQTPPQHLPRGIDLPPLPLLNHQPEHLPHIFHRLIMLPPVAQHMHRPHDPPSLQLPYRRAHIRPRHAQRLRNLLRRQRPRRQIQQRVNLRHRPVDPPPRPHLAPVQDVRLLHSSQVGHIDTFSSNRIYRMQRRHVNRNADQIYALYDAEPEPAPQIPWKSGASAPASQTRKRSRALAPAVALASGRATLPAIRQGFLTRHFLRRSLLRRLRPLPLLIPTIMKRLVRRLFFHIPQLTPAQILMSGPPPSAVRSSTTRPSSQNSCHSGRHYREESAFSCQ